MRTLKEKKTRARRPSPKTTPERLTELQAMTYAEYLKTPEWYRRRAVALKYAGNRCMLCYSEKQPLNVHHRTYERCPGQERCSDLVTLCSGCHHLFHQVRKLSR